MYSVEEEERRKIEWEEEERKYLSSAIKHEIGKKLSLNIIQNADKFTSNS